MNNFEKLCKKILQEQYTITGREVLYRRYGKDVADRMISKIIQRGSDEYLEKKYNLPKYNKENVENIYLERGKPNRMGDYIITYVRDSQHWVNTYYQVNYKKINKQGEVDYEFNLYPNGQINPKFGLVANPDTKHYVSHDVFTYVSSVPSQKASAKFINERTHEVKPGDTIYTNNAYAILMGINTNTNAEKVDINNFQVLLGAELKVYTLDKVYDAMPMYGVQNNSASSFEALVDEAKLKFNFKGVNPANKTITITTAEKDNSGDFVIMKAIIFPWINLVWAGTIVMIVGFIISIIRSIRWIILNNIEIDVILIVFFVKQVIIFIICLIIYFYFLPF
jgi:cytochrome c-type biogenesis protein CcmF